MLKVKPEWHQSRENRNSLTTGDPENSGLSIMQLTWVSLPVLFSINFFFIGLTVRNIVNPRGASPRTWGETLTPCSLEVVRGSLPRSLEMIAVGDDENHQIQNISCVGSYAHPGISLVSICAAWRASTYAESLYSYIPDNKCADIGSTAIYYQVICNFDFLGPASIVAIVAAISLIVQQSDGPRWQHRVG